MLALVEQWRDSGQSRKDFCHLHGIKVSTLSYWVKKSEEQNNGVGFTQLLPSQVSSGRVDIIYLRNDRKPKEQEWLRFHLLRCTPSGAWWLFFSTTG